MNVLKQFIAVFLGIYLAMIAYTVLTAKGYHVPIAHQWIVLGQWTVGVSAFIFGIPGNFFNICMWVDKEDGTKEIRAEMYNTFKDKTLGKIWIVIPVVLAAVSFQYALSGYVVGCLLFASWIFTSRGLHANIIREAKITVLN